MEVCSPDLVQGFLLADSAPFFPQLLERLQRINATVFLVRLVLVSFGSATLPKDRLVSNSDKKPSRAYACNAHEVAVRCAIQCSRPAPT